MSATHVAGLTIELEHDNPSFDVQLTPRPGEQPGIEYLDIHLRSEVATRPEPLSLKWSYPIVDTHHRTGSASPTQLCAFGRTNSTAPRGTGLVSERPPLAWALSLAHKSCRARRVGSQTSPDATPPPPTPRRWSE